MSFVLLIIFAWHWAKQFLKSAADPTPSTPNDTMILSCPLCNSLSTHLCKACQKGWEFCSFVESTRMEREIR
ncbi:MAG: hypothetical protein J3R72DRAFT_441492 [Linnemannia gamsii]|nr:MAG: hypothetical protein J3R72DRAFT_441492 [Linnemannia gamsii]